MASRDMDSNLENYFYVDTEIFRKREPVPCDIFLYFRLNKKMIKYCRKGSIIPDKTVDRFLKYKVSQLCIHKNDEPAFKSFGGVIKDEPVADWDLSGVEPGSAAPPSNEQPEESQPAGDAADVPGDDVQAESADMAGFSDAGPDQPAQEGDDISWDHGEGPEDARPDLDWDQAEGTEGEASEGAVEGTAESDAGVASAEDVDVPDMDPYAEPAAAPGGNWFDSDDDQEAADTDEEVPEIPEGPLVDTVDVPEETQEIVSALDEEHIEEMDRLEVIASNSKEIMTSFISLAEGDSQEAIEEAFQNCQKTVHAVMDCCSYGGIYAKLQHLKEKMDMEHSTYVSTFAVMFAMVLGITNKEALADIGAGGLFHDIGKAILSEMEKGDDLEGENVDVKEHVQLGAEILGDYGDDITENIRTIVLQHHEHYDGSGYPEGISGDDIFLLSYVVAMANEFDNMTKRVDSQLQKTPLEALKQIYGDVNDASKPTHFPPDLMERLYQTITAEVT